MSDEQLKGMQDESDDFEAHNLKGMQDEGDDVEGHMVKS